MKVALVVITDGRGEFLERGLDSLKHLDVEFSRTVCVNDSGDPAYREWLDATFKASASVHHARRQGLAAAIRSAWATLALMEPTDLVLHLEDDIVFTKPVDLADWAFPLEVNPDLAQVVLQRAPQAAEEHAAGSLLESVMTKTPITLREFQGVAWTEHDLGFSLQPCLYPWSTVQVGWPEHGGETEFNAALRAVNPDVRFAYLGHPGADIAYEHIGHEQRSPGWKV